MCPPTQCIPAWRHRRPMWCSLPSRTLPTACRASGRREAPCRVGEEIHTKIDREVSMRRLIAALFASLALVLPATAQDKYPSKPVKIIVPYAPGGATDITARIFGEQLRAALGQNFVIESKPGAFGILAIEELARAKPDGYTLMIGN